MSDKVLSTECDIITNRFLFSSELFCEIFKVFSHRVNACLCVITTQISMNRLFIIAVLCRSCLFVWSIHSFPFFALFALLC